MPEDRETGNGARRGGHRSADAAAQSRPIDYEKIADEVLRIMKAELNLERERGARTEGKRW